MNSWRAGNSDDTWCLGAAGREAWPSGAGLGSADMLARVRVRARARLRAGAGTRASTLRGVGLLRFGEVVIVIAGVGFFRAIGLSWSIRNTGSTGSTRNIGSTGSTRRTGSPGLRGRV